MLFQSAIKRPAQLFANFLGTWVLVGVPGVTDQNLTP